MQRLVPAAQAKTALVALWVLISIMGCSRSSEGAVSSGSGTTLEKGLSPEHLAAANRADSSEILMPRYTSTQGAMDSLRPEDRLIVEAFYDQFGTSVFEFQTPEQFAWMFRSGYPTPAEVVEAASLPTEELLRRFEEGHLKSGYFYLARMSRPEVNRTLQEADHLDEVARTLLAGGSPFAGYSYYHYQLNARQDPLAAFAGLAWADTAGDTRAGLEVASMARHLEATNPGSIPPGAMLFAYKALLNVIAVNNRELLSRPPNRYPY